MQIEHGRTVARRPGGRRVISRTALAAALLLASAAARAQPICDAATPPLGLPFEAQIGARQVIQGVDGSFSHGGRYRYAWDFEMPEGTPVVAAADGIVVEVIDQFDRGGPDHSFEEKANLIVVDHGRNRFTIYQHLKRGGALVHEGDQVARGQRIGLSGATGWTTRPHLHFSVIDHRNRSVAACIEGVAGGWPIQGHSYRAASITVAPGEHALSTLPWDAFADNGIALTCELPSRWLSTDSPLRVSGRTTRPARQVAAFLLPRGGRAASRTALAKVGPDGRFAVTLDFRGAEGSQDFALAIVAPDGSYHSDYSIPVSLRQRPH